MLHILSMLTMLIDHIGYIFFSDTEILRYIGRIALPLYSYGVMLAIMSKNKKRYIKRILIIALISQYPFMVVFNVFAANVVFTLFMGYLALYTLERVKSKSIKVYIMILIFFVTTFIPMDYGFYVVALMIIYRYSPKKMYLLYHFLLNIAFIACGFSELYQMYSLLGTFFIVFSEKLPNVKVNKTFYRLFYPLHLWAIWTILEFFIA